MGHPWASPYGLSSLTGFKSRPFQPRTCPEGVPNRASPASPYGPSLGLAQPDRLQIRVWALGPWPLG